MTAAPLATGRPPGGGGPGGRVARKSAGDIAQLDEHPVPLPRITALFRPYRFRLALVVALIVITSLISLASPFLVKHLIDDAIPHQNVALLLTLVGAMLAITVLTQVLGVLQTWITTLIGQRVMHDLRTRLFAHLQRMPLSFFTRTRSGEVQSRVTNDINAMQSVVTDSATSIASNVTTAVGTATAMAFLSWRLSLLSLLVLPPAIYLTRRVALQRKKIQSRAQRTLADMQTQIEESLSINGVVLAKTLGSGPALSQRFEGSSGTLTELEVQSQLAGRWRMGTMAIVFAAIPAMIYLAAGLPATSGGMTIGTLVAFVALQSQLFRPLMGVLNVGAQVVTSMALFSRIFEYLDLPVDIDEPAEPADLDTSTARGELRFDHVTVTYDDADRSALDDITLAVPAGATVAIVGATGSGKSTLASLISRLQDPTSGAVSIDGHDLRTLPLQTIADLVGVVSQESYLLHASVADNLRYAVPDASDEQIIRAARAAQVHDLISSLPDGCDTVVGTRGYRFSGGEKQRIALARTILRDPKILVLDEATSALDNTTERAVQRALDNARIGRTTLTIAHRLSTVRDAELIVVLDQGRIVEQGSHEQLLLRGGRYAALWDAQLTASAA
ncbi:ABC transporter ATP-binding protein [Yimella sp. cx-51]|uniref:ABC transporter ATP-binding protein n=1 Tax=Yimella sp. cx-51 TaxID=2770551 RepID=UPI00165D8FDA|nr:ABC transporter ATP-binding protein [Yimella sp. cx-51]MBC9957717.1 ABC transporter ATP-binding protein [Yimella sp. cx-51]QTH36933.1 ABC transporter ATP-binding protein [Yimella sp. cx-51]